MKMKAGVVALVVVLALVGATVHAATGHADGSACIICEWCPFF